VKDLGYALRRFALPVRSGDNKNTTIVARGAAADLVEVEGKGVDHLNAEITVFFPLQAQ